MGEKAQIHFPISPGQVYEFLHSFNLSDFPEHEYQISEKELTFESQVKDSN